MCSSTWFLWFFLSLDCPVNDEKREKNPTRWKRWTIALLDTRSTNKEYSEKVALRRNRSRSRRYQQQESSFLLTRASSALHFSDADSIRSCESSARFPSFGVFCYEKKTKPEHSFRQNVRLHQSTFLLPPFCEKGRWRPQMIRVRMRDNENNGNKYVTSFSLFLFWTTTMPW